jgi:putative membrane protein
MDDTSRGDLRVFLAGQRTMLAWVRTGVALMGFGFVVARFGLFLREMGGVRGVETSVHQGSVSLWAGTGLLLVGVWVNVLAAARFARFSREFKAGRDPTATGIGAEIGIAGVLAALGVAMAVYLTFLR